MSQEPRFLTREMVDAIHEQQIETYGGHHGVLNEHLLESAINQPRSTYFFGDGDLYEVAAAYAFHIIADHPYWDGNKRTGNARPALSWRPTASTPAGCPRNKPTRR